MNHCQSLAHDQLKIFIPGYMLVCERQSGKSMKDVYRQFYVTEMRAVLEKQTHTNHRHSGIQDQVANNVPETQGR